MKKNTKKILAVLCLAQTAALMVSGCGKRRIQESIEAESYVATAPDFEIHDDIVIDYDESQDTLEDLLDIEDYPLSNYIDTWVDTEEGIVYLIWPLADEATEEDAVEYANAIVRGFNDATSEQDFSIRTSGPHDFGGIYDTLAVNVQVFRESDIMNPDNYLVSMTIPAGEYREIVPFSQYDGLNAVIMPDGIGIFAGGKYELDEAENDSEGADKASEGTEDASEEETSAEEAKK